MSRLVLLVSFVASLAACGGAEPPAQKPASATDDPMSVCVTAFERQRECTDLFIPALVAKRVELDKPAGIAETDASGGRDALVARAHEEWKNDSTDEAIAATCQKLSTEIPPDVAAQLTGQVQQCLAADGCQAFVDCVIPVISSNLH
jgi:hypothetical protein